MLTMTTDKKTKINQLITTWVSGTPHATSHLAGSGYSNDLLAKYKRSGWLESFGKGAYVRSGDVVDWLGALYTLQSELSLPVHAGGKTVLQLKGYSHYLPEKQDQVFLYCPQKQLVPSWFREARLGVKFVITRTNLLPENFKEGFSETRERNFSVRISAPERAAMEMLHLVPKIVGFDEAQKIMENLVALRSDMVQVLLEACRSIKVKRLFLYMAHRCNHSWVSKIDESKIDIGMGKRMIVKRGQLDDKYMISVPRR